VGEVCNPSNGNCEKGLPPIEIPEDIIIFRKDCGSKYLCGDWSECQGKYDINNLLTGSSISGEVTRTCEDVNKCSQGFIESMKCNIKANVSIRTAEWCDEEYIELVDSTSGDIVSRLKKTGNLFQSYTISINLDGTAYCAYCYDGIKDYDEEGIDCGGSCSNSCEEEKPFKIKRSIWDYLIPIVIGVLVISIAILLYLIIDFIRWKEDSQLAKLLRKYRLWKSRGHDVASLDREAAIIRNALKKHQ
jgi:hypothetical protein